MIDAGFLGAGAKGGRVALLQWSAKYLTGIDIIDADHQALFAAINTLHDKLAANAQKSEIEATLAMLADYVDGHFGREEALMEDCDYPDLVEHMGVHRRISHQVHDYRTAFEETGGKIDMDDFIEFLGSWLKGHIAMSDAAYIPYVTASDGRADLR